MRRKPEHEAARAVSADDASLSDELAALTEPRRGPVEARRKAMDLLARREHARGELLAKLEKAGFDADVSFGAIEQLRDDGLQSDARFAESFVSSRFSRGKGPVRIRQELRERDVPQALIDAAFEAFDGDWTALAVEVCEKKFGRVPAPDFREKARRMRFLQYRGFESEHIASAVGED